MPSSTSPRAWHDVWRELALWIGVLTGPVVFLTALEVNYVLTYVACETQQTWFMHAAVLVAAALVGASGWLAWTHGPAHSDRRPTPPATPETTENRARWMSIAGVLTAAWFVLVILSFEIPVLVLGPCH
jgi:hypothetical protein